MHPCRRMLLAGLAAIGLVACAPRGEAPASAPLKVFAAASLTDVLPPIAEAFAAETGATAPVLVFASSAELARQIEQGADADVFISADEAWMDYLAERDLIEPATRRTWLTNSLVLVAPASRPFRLELGPGADLRGALDAWGLDGRLVIADPDSVPAGRYAREALESLQIWAKVEDRLGNASNVRDALRFVESGDAAAGIVYATDARASGDRIVVVAAFDPSTHTPVTYPVAAIQGRSADAFLAFLKDETVRRMTDAAGFGEH